MAESSGNITKTVKSTSGLEILDADFDGTVSDLIVIDGDLPIVGLLIKLSDAATVTITVEEDGNSFKLYGSDGVSVLTLGDGTDLLIARFTPELAPFSSFKIVASATQTNAKIYAMLAS